MKKIALSHVRTTLIAFVTFISLSCGDDVNLGPAPVITGFNRNSGIIGSTVIIYGNNFMPPVPLDKGVGPHANTSIVAFNGAIAEAEFVYQDSIGKQRIHTVVPVGATNGAITVTANGITGTSLEDFIIVIPVYEPNVSVTTVPGISGSDVAVDAIGNIYASSLDSYKIYKRSPDGTITILFEGDQDHMPLAIVADADGTIYAAIEHTIRKISPDGTMSTLAGSSTYGYADGKGATAQFWFPLDISLDASGNVYVAEIGNHKIRKITPDGTVSTLAGSTEGFADGMGTNAQFKLPQGVTVDATGNVFVADSRNNRIRKITPTGDVTTFAGSTPGYLEGLSHTAQFNYPLDIAMDASGNIYVCDAGNFVVRKITPDGTVGTLAGSTGGSADGLGANAQFRVLTGIAVDSDGNVFVADAGNHNIRKIVTN